MAYGSFIVGGGGTIPHIGDIVFTTVKDNSPAKRYKNTVWELVAQNRVPMGAGDGHEGGETVEAGLPNITGTMQPRASGTPENVLGVIREASGAFAVSANTGNDNTSPISIPFNDTYKADMASFDASRSNPIYGASDTVQPSGYYFYFWRRVS